MNLMKNVMMASLLASSASPVLSGDTLPNLQNGIVPRTFEELWGDYDPRREPLEVEVLKEWEHDGVVLKVLRYRIGMFKGKKAMMAAVFGYPKGAQGLPGLLQIHGGGQYAHWNAVFTNAKRGYATISIAWAGRIEAPDYHVGPEEERLFWDGKTNDPAYKLTTDWGPLDVYHAPCRHPETRWGSTEPSEWTIDDVDSPRNSPWFSYALAARRALTFLEQQSEVDKARLGVYGHSMGGQQTVLTAGTDSRVKAAAPSCGGVSDRNTGHGLVDACVSDPVNLQHLTCPIFFLSPANDFNARINDLQSALKEIRSTDWRVTCAPHHNHQDTAPYEVATQLWFDQQLKGTFKVPLTPRTTLELKSKTGVPILAVKPDTSMPIVGVDVFYAQQGAVEGQKEDRDHVMNRFWHYAATRKNGQDWRAELPLSSTDKPLWVYANVVYQLDKPVVGAGYYYGTYTAITFNVSSAMDMASPSDLKTAGVKVAQNPSLMIETFTGDWRKEWFSYTPSDWPCRTHKVYDERWVAPANARLEVQVRSVLPNTLVIGIDQWGAEVSLHGGLEWQHVSLSLSDLSDASGKSPKDWKGIKELRLGSQERLTAKVDGKDEVRVLGGPWKGEAPLFTNLCWVVAGQER